MKRLLILLLLLGCTEKPTEIIVGKGTWEAEPLSILEIKRDTSVHVLYPDRDPMKIECPDKSGKPLSILETKRMWPEWTWHEIRQ